MKKLIIALIMLLANIVWSEEYFITNPLPTVNMPCPICEEPMLLFAGVYDDDDLQSPGGITHCGICYLYFSSDQLIKTEHCPWNKEFKSKP